MVVFFSITLVFAILGLVSLLWIKRWELRTGKLLVAGVRPQVGNMSRTFLIWVERVLPHLITVYAQKGARTAESTMHHAAARALLTAEHSLERVLRTLRGVTEQPKSNKEASVFLREVAEHKRKLIYSKKVEEQAEEE